MQYKKELVPGIVLTVIAVLYLFFTTQIQPFTGLGATPLTNRFMPFFWGTCLLILSVMLIIRGVRMRKKELAAGKVATSGGFAIFWDNYKEVVLSFILLAIYRKIKKKLFGFGYSCCCSCIRALLYIC